MARRLGPRIAVHNRGHGLELIVGPAPLMDTLGPAIGLFITLAIYAFLGFLWMRQVRIAPLDTWKDAFGIWPVLDVMFAVVLVFGMGLLALVMLAWVWGAWRMVSRIVQLLFGQQLLTVYHEKLTALARPIGRSRAYPVDEITAIDVVAGTSSRRGKPPASRLMIKVGEKKHVLLTDLPERDLQSVKEMLVDQCLPHLA